jgi:hypothetical protein
MEEKAAGQSDQLPFKLMGRIIEQLYRISLFWIVVLNYNLNRGEVEWDESF